MPLSPTMIDPLSGRPVVLSFAAFARFSPWSSALWCDSHGSSFFSPWSSLDLRALALIASTLSASSFGGWTSLPSLCPSYQLTFTGGMSPRAGNSYVTCAQPGYVSVFSSSDFAWMLEGWPSFSAMNGRLAVWQPMSPSAPVPKSHQPRQEKG